MDAVFQQITSQGQGSVSGIVNFLQNANLLGRGEDAQHKIDEAFSNVRDSNHVTSEEFKEAMSKLAAQGLVSLDAVVTNVSGAASGVRGKVSQAFSHGQGRHDDDD